MNKTDDTERAVVDIYRLENICVTYLFYEYD